MKPLRIGLLLIGMLVIFSVYLVSLASRVATFLSLETITSWGIGIALVVILSVSIWLIIRELIFGFQSHRLTKIIVREDENCDPSAPHDMDTTSLLWRTLSREDAVAQKERYEQMSQQLPTDWKSWYRLGLVYEVCGERTAARAAVRRAIVTFRAPATEGARNVLSLRRSGR